MKIKILIRIFLKIDISWIFGKRKAESFLEVHYVKIILPKLVSTHRLARDSVLILNPLLTVIVFAFFIFMNTVFHFWFCGLAFMAAATNLAITAGYHRLFAHRSLKPTPDSAFFFPLDWPSAFQGSALKWSSDHRRHHWKVDTEEDPTR